MKKQSTIENVSVLMAAYNGEKYISQQIESIVMQLSEKDELLISDDGSTDNTVNIIKQYVDKYSFIKLLDGPQKGFIENFQFLLNNASKEIVLISDQDDVWMDNKIQLIKKTFEDNKDTWVLLHNALFIDDNGNAIDSNLFKERKAKRGFVKNWMKSSYYGCCMALRRDYVSFILPFPLKKYCYDQWIGLFAELNKKTLFLNDELILHRLHTKNQSQKRNFIYRIKFRVVLLQYIHQLLIRKKNEQHNL